MFVYRITKIKLFFILFFLFDVTLQYQKCNQILMKTFMLQGMKFAVYDPMEICEHVKDKCCTVADEIKITKLWKETTKPVLHSHIDNTMYFISKIMKQFWQIGKIDLRMMSLKYIIKKTVPYKEIICHAEVKTESPEEQEKFDYKFDEAQLKSQILRHNTFSKNDTDNQIVAPYQSYDKNGNRRWGISDTSIGTPFSLPNIQINDPDYKKLICVNQKSNFVKEFIVVNEEKAEFCYSLYDKILAFNNQKFELFLSNVKSGLLLMARFKGAIYCSICDAHQQKFFDSKKNLFQFNSNFCQNNLRTNKTTIMFLHIIFIEYADILLQYMECYETDGQIFNLPFENFLLKYKRRIPLIKKCLENVDNPEFLKQCWFICEQYSVMNISKFWEGELTIFKRVYLALYSFLRKIEKYSRQTKKMKSNTEILGNVNGMLFEPLNASNAVSKKYYLDERVREKVLGKLNTNHKYSLSDLNMADRIFQFYNDRLGKKAIKKLKDEYLGMKTKKKELIMRLVKKLEKFKKWSKKKQKRYQKYIGKSKINLLDNQIYKYKIKSRVYKSHRPIRKLSKKQPSLKLIQNSTTKDLRKLVGYKYNQNNNYDYLNGDLELLTGERIRFKKKNLKRKKLEEELKKSQKQKEEKNKKNNDNNYKPIKLKENSPEASFLAQNEVKIFRPPPGVLHIEPAAEIFDKDLYRINVAKFKVEFMNEGINPLIYVQNLQFDMDITTLIKRKFKLPEKLTQPVITAYLRMSPNYVNEFNHDFKGQILQANPMILKAHKYLMAKKAYQTEQDEELKEKHKIVFDNMKYDLFLDKIKRKDNIFMDKIKKQIEKDQLDRKQQQFNQKIKMNHHIDEDYFESNFHGFKDLFVKLFGTQIIYLKFIITNII